MKMASGNPRGFAKMRADTNRVEIGADGPFDSTNWKAPPGPAAPKAPKAAAPKKATITRKRATTKTRAERGKRSKLDQFKSWLAS